MQRLTAEQNAERWAIIGRPPTIADCAHVDGLTVEMLDALIAAGYCDPEQTQNDSPTVADLLEFMREHHGVTAHGYVIDPGRGDSRVSLEGLAYSGKPSRELLMDFTRAFRHADEFDVDDRGMRCWWD